MDNEPPPQSESLSRHGSNHVSYPVEAEGVTEPSHDAVLVGNSAAVADTLQCSGTLSSANETPRKDGDATSSPVGDSEQASHPIPSVVETDVTQEVALEPEAEGPDDLVGAKAAEEKRVSSPLSATKCPSNGPVSMAKDAHDKSSSKARQSALASASSSSGRCTTIPGGNRPLSSQITVSSANKRSAMDPVRPQLLTAGEEYDFFRMRHRVAPSYRGPIYAVEDVHVPCEACHGPVDPVTRVPVGKLFFHPTCVRCVLCHLSSITESYRQVGSHAICSTCFKKGDARCVPRTHGVNATRGKATKPNSCLHRASAAAAATTAFNAPLLPGATAPSLHMNSVHNPRNTTRRSMDLIRRQQYYTQNDCNIACQRPPAPIVPVTETRAQIRDRRRSE